MSMTLAAELRAHARELLAAADRAEALQADLEQVIALHRQRDPDVGEKPLGCVEAAHILHCDPRTVARWAEAGTIPAHRLPGAKKWTFLASELRQFDEDQMRRRMMRAVG